VKQHHVQGVARVLQPDQVGERQGDALGGREPILALEYHAVAAVEHQHRGAGALIFPLGHHQVVVLDLE
jgi:hypothetical protein